MTSAVATEAVAGITSIVEVMIDRWGVPHIFANNEADLFFAQGYQAAQLRLWQLDMWRRRGLGLVSEILGDKYVEQDVIARLLLFRGNVDAEWSHYGENSRARITQFVAGVNAHIDRVLRHRDELPLEFVRLDYLPVRWQPEDILRIRAGGRHDNAREEVLRSVTLSKFGYEAELVRKPLSIDWKLQVPSGLNLEDIEADLLAPYEQFMAFMGAGQQHLDGSNNWVISGSRCHGGRPLLANDPHRDMTLPTLRYLCHLNAPGIDVIGATEPHCPGIVIGHNRTVAFGLTIFPSDQEDLYVYNTNEAGSHYWYDGKWVEFTSLKEAFKVRDREPIVRTLQFSRHGPVVASRHERRKAYALRAAWLEPGAAPYLKGGLQFMDCKHVDHVRVVAKKWSAPSLNFVFADITGAVGIQSGGVI